MARLVVRCFTISLDGYGAGPDQTLETPMGIGTEGLHAWMIGTAKFRSTFGMEGGTTGVDNDLTVQGFANVGAWILGRNMFGPVRGPWPDESWRGWWGETPPYHCPVFVLTNYARAPLEMDGGTTFHFVTGGIEEALEWAREAAGDQDIRLGGGVSTLQQYLQLRLVDELHIAVSPLFIGSGENLYAGINLKALGYECVERIATEKATHLIIRRVD